MKKLFFLALTSLLLKMETYGQASFSRYFTENLLPIVDNSTYPQMNFAWNMPGEVQISMNKGLTELEEGDLKAAIYSFEDVISQSPKFLPAHYYLGVCFKKLNELKKAEESFLSSLAIDDKNSETLLMIGEVYQQQSKIDKAESYFEKVIKATPNTTRSYFNLGSIEVSRNNHRKALKYYEKCHEIDSLFINAYVMQAIIKIPDIKNDKSALVYLNQAINYDSTHTESLFWRGLIYLYLNEPDNGIHDWNKLVSYNPDNNFFLMMRGFLNIEINDFDQAYNDLKKAVLSNPANEEKFRRGETILDKRIDLQYAANYAMRFSYGLDEEALSFFKKGFCFFIGDKKEKAIENFKSSAKVQPSAAAFFLEALTFEHLKKHDSAFHYYNKALELDNDILDAHKKRALYRFELRDWKGTYADLKEMERLQPGLLLTFRLRGLIKAVQKDYYGAILDFSKYLQSDSTDFEIFAQRGACRSFVSDERGANEDFRKSLKYDRYNVGLYNRVVDSYLVLKDTTNAIETLNECSEGMPDQFFPLIRMAELLIAQRKWEEAQPIVDKAISRFHPTYYDKILFSKAIFIKGLLYFHLKSYPMAIKEFDKALEVSPMNFEARYYRGKSFKETGNKSKALGDFKVLKNQGYADSEIIFDAMRGNP